MCYNKARTKEENKKVLNTLLNYIKKKPKHNM